MKTAVTLFISVFIVVMMPWRGIAQNAGERSSIQWNNLSLRVSLDSIMKLYTESIVYLDKDVEGKDVSVMCIDCSFDQALNAVLSGTSLIWIRRGNQIILKEQDAPQNRRHATISGTVTDSLTSEWIVGASILLQDSSDHAYNTVRRWCSTNAFGFFSLPNVPFGRYKIVARAMGYETVKCNIDIIGDESMRSDIRMVPKDIILKEVTIEGHRTALTSVVGFSRSAYRRSVPTDQNQYLLDGGRVYNPTHFGGVMNTFSTEVLNDIQIVLGGLPPYYGGRVGGIVDLSMRDGSKQGISGSVGLGSLGSNLSLEGPISDKTTFLVSGRRGYTDAAMQLIPTEVEPSRMGSYELVTKIAHRFSMNNQVSVSGYIGRDSYRNKVEGSGENLDNDFSWSNSMLGLRWVGIGSPSLFLHASAVYSKYDFNIQHLLNWSSSFYSGTQLSSDYAIEDFSVCAHAENYYDAEHTFRAGVELVNHRMNGHISEFSSQLGYLTLDNYSCWELGVYLQDQWKIHPRVGAELGGRFTSFMGNKGSFSAFDPRFSLLVHLNEQTRLYSSLSAINQFIHPYRYTGIFLIYPTIFWYPSTEEMKPSTSLHATLGIERSLNDDEYIISAESYYRITNNLHEFGLDITGIQNRVLENMGFLGTGRTYGLICSFRKRTGNLTGSISYNLSWSFETFEEINEGKAFAPPFDRRHELQIASSYMAGSGWIFGALCVVASGQSSAIKTSVLQTEQVTTGVDFLAGRNVYSELIDVNGSRLPGFQRLELNVLRRFVLWDLPCQFSIRFLNSYGLVDPFKWKLYKNYFLGRLKWDAVLEEQELFPLYPVMEFMVRF